MVTLVRDLVTSVVSTACDLGLPVGAVLRVHGHPAAVAASDPAAGRCDAVVARHQLGPCLDALDAACGVMVPDVVVEDRWLPWRTAVLGSGLRSALAIPARVDDAVELAVTAYRTVPGAWPGDAVGRLAAHASSAAATVGRALGTAAAPPGPATGWPSGLDPEPAASLRALLATPGDAAVVDEALTAVVRCNGCTALEALSMLLGAASGRAVTLGDVARTVLAALDRPAPVLEVPVRDCVAAPPPRRTVPARDRAAGA
ncbi:GAF domain-containing protein [Cellulomonas carbonis]|uniref:ANTAR domain-containing protein n=1 Tax=Cellulomonas carbonis T26 TaxID=947969 RepID=A0A0A0BWW0_9CELL|nr:GAF domain-containing protein [Cellulomonas carbonis]KGM11644.1 hypothetical protein N868_08265 [Cellulomonas carbonis T26]GGC03078.1 hypothetical protein GCM10010972_15120 [Cellulomonas carbonis]